MIIIVSDNYGQNLFWLAFSFSGCREFECKTGSCIDKKRRCDGKDDCNIYQEDNDFSDEDFCERMY